jgi:hypothetical protein
MKWAVVKKASGSVMPVALPSCSILQAPLASPLTELGTLKKFLLVVSSAGISWPGWHGAAFLVLWSPRPVPDGWVEGPVTWSIGAQIVAISAAHLLGLAGAHWLRSGSVKSKELLPFLFSLDYQLE